VVVVLRAVEALAHGFHVAILGQRKEIRAAILAEAFPASAAVVQTAPQELERSLAPHALGRQMRGHPHWGLSRIKLSREDDRADPAQTQLRLSSCLLHWLLLQPIVKLKQAVSWMVRPVLLPHELQLHEGIEYRAVA